MKKTSGVKRERKGKKHVDEPASAAFAVKLKGARQTMPLQPGRTNTFSKKRITDTAGTVKGGPGWDRWDIWRKHFNIFQQYIAGDSVLIEGSLEVKLPTIWTTQLHNYTPLHEITLHYTTLHYTTLHSATLHYTTLHYTTLH